MQFLLAKCYAELQQYGPAEDALLQNCRALFRKTENEDIDEWILTTTPCPVPNGAAGLQLMGDICRNSNRKERAMHYFRLALELDPIMWTSYEALCEMGDDAINPVQVFGVCPEALAPSPQEEDEEEEAAQPNVESRGVLTPSFALSHHGKRNCNRETIGTNNFSHKKIRLHSTGGNTNVDCIECVPLAQQVSLCRFFRQGSSDVSSVRDSQLDANH
jgi:hypothetical protein